MKYTFKLFQDKILKSIKKTFIDWFPGQNAFCESLSTERSNARVDFSGLTKNAFEPNH